MKRLYILLLLLFPMFVFASTNTFDRTVNDLRIPSKIKYEDNMYSNVMTTPSVDSSEKIYDFADLLSSFEEEELYIYVNEFIEKYGMDLCLVTINNNPKNSTLEYADDFYDYNDFSPDGMVFIIDMQNRVFYLSTAGKGMLYYDDYRIENILSSIDYYMGEHDYFNSLKIVVNELSTYAESGMSENGNKYIVDDGVIYKKTPYLTIGIISLIGSGIITLVLSLKNKPVKLATDCGEYLKNGEITISQDHFVSSHTTKTYIPPSDSGSSHSSFSGGGGGFHSSSSGTSHGGGGHRF